MKLFLNDKNDENFERKLRAGVIANYIFSIVYKRT